MKFTVDPGDTFKQSMNEARIACENLTVPLTLIAQSWYKSNRALSQLAGPGKWPDLAAKTKQAKTKRFGTPYPPLFATGKMLYSIQDPGQGDAINRIINRNSLFLGTKNPIAKYQQFGTATIPARPFVLIGSEQVAPDGINRRLEAWVSILAKFCADQAKKPGGT